jgi:hypothetical protein
MSASVWVVTLTNRSPAQLGVGVSEVFTVRWKVSKWMWPALELATFAATCQEAASYATTSIHQHATRKCEQSMRQRYMGV